AGDELRGRSTDRPLEDEVVDEPHQQPNADPYPPFHTEHADAERERKAKTGIEGKVCETSAERRVLQYDGGYVPLFGSVDPRRGEGIGHCRAPIMREKPKSWVPFCR